MSVFDGIGFLENGKAVARVVSSSGSGGSTPTAAKSIIPQPPLAGGGSLDQDRVISLNSGPGSGLDADTVDGKHAADLGGGGGAPGTTDHAALSNLAYADSGHTGFSPTSHAHAESDVTGLTSDLAGKAATAHTHAEGDITNLTSDLAGKQAASEKAQANGYASLGSDSKVPAAQLPSALTAPVTATFNATTDWGAASGGYYTITVTHNLNTLNVTVVTWDDTAPAAPVLCDPEIVTGASVNTITIKVPSVPDKRFAGRVVIGGNQSSGHTHAESDITNLVTDLAAKVPTARTISTTAPLTGGGALSGNLTLAIDAGYQPRERLTSARTYYVRVDGNDANTGLVDSAAGAFLTIQAAVNAVLALDCSAFNVTIQIRDGTYTGAVIVGPIFGTGTLTITGNAATPTNVSISTTSATAISAYAFACVSALTISNLQVKTTTSGYGIIAAFDSRVNISGVDFGACASGHVFSGYSSYLAMSGNCTISGGAALAWASVMGGTINFVSRTITISGTPAFGYFAYCEKNAVLQAVTITFTGSATGQRYLAQLNGIIQTNGGGANYFPGDSAGATATGGQYA